MQFTTILTTLALAATGLAAAVPQAAPAIVERACDTSECKSGCEAAGYVWGGNDACWGDARVCDCSLP